MADITMTYSSLESAASQINSAKSDLDSVIAALDSAVSSLDGNYSGVSYEAFRNAWQESKPTMQKISEAVAAFAPELNTAVAKQQEAEGTAAGRMGALAF